LYIKNKVEYPFSIFGEEVKRRGGGEGDKGREGGRGERGGG
jgi:hypothetical protein